MNLYSKHDTRRVVDLFERILKDLAFHGLSHVQQQATLKHLSSLRKDPRDLLVTCKLEADQHQLGKTTITITADHKPIITG